jgi:hypothetical protein
VARSFGVDPRSHRGVHPLHRHGFPARGVYFHFELGRFDGPRFPHHGEVQMIVNIFLGPMVKCWIPKIFLTNHSTESSTFSHSM